MSSRHPFRKAYMYTSTFITHDGKHMKSTNVLAIKHGSEKTASEIVEGWNVQSRKSIRNYRYELVKELDVNEAIKMKSNSSNCIENSWQFIEHLPYCTLAIAFEELQSIN